MESAGINSRSTPVSDAVEDSISQVGAGAFGVVWCVSGGASDTGRRYAVKKLCNCLDTLHSAERTFSELKALTSLKHDNILSANTFVLWPNAGNFTDVFVISDLMETDLHRIIASGQTLNKAHIQLFIYQILRGLKYLHSTKIVHSDIKPGNILVNSDCRLKIGDFGLACNETSSLPLVCSPITNSTREVRGTLSYVAPELLLGIPAVTTAADLWSTGCLLVEMLTRRVLFPAASTTQQLDMTMEVVGCPRGIEDFRDAAQPAVSYMRQKMAASHNSASKPLLEQLLPTADHTVKHLLTRLLVFTPRQRLSASQALSHIYVNPGQRLYHSTLCSCCKPHSNKDGGSSRMNGSDKLAFSQHSTTNQVESVCDRLEPVCNDPFCIDDQLGMESVEDLKGKIQELHTKIRKQRASSDSEYQLTIRSILTQTVPKQ